MGPGLRAELASTHAIHRPDISIQLMMPEPNETTFTHSQKFNVSEVIK